MKSIKKLNFGGVVLKNLARPLFIYLIFSLYRVIIVFNFKLVLIESIFEVIESIPKLDILYTKNVRPAIQVGNET